MARIKRAITTKKGHQDATSISYFLDFKNRPFSIILNKDSEIVFSLKTLDRKDQIGPAS